MNILYVFIVKCFIYFLVDSTVIFWGDIVGIVIAVILIVVISGLIIYLLASKTKRTRTDQRVAPQTSPPPKSQAYIPSSQSPAASPDIKRPVTPLKPNNNYSYFKRKDISHGDDSTLIVPNDTLTSKYSNDSDHTYVDLVATSPRHHVVLRNDLPKAMPVDENGRLTYETNLNGFDAPDRLERNRSSVLRLPSLPDMSLKVSEMAGRGRQEATVRRARPTTARPRPK